MHPKTYRSAAIWGKKRVCRYLASDGALQHLVPQTKALTMNHLREMLDHHAVVYVKPDIGSMGIGVNKLARADVGYTLYATQWRKQVQHTYATLTDCYKAIKRRSSSPMIIQEAVAIDSVGTSELPYDIRAMVQRKPGGPWTCTGFMVKVGAAGRIVTNYYQGGQIWTLNRLWKEKGYDEAIGSSRTEMLKAKALEVAQLLSRKKQGMREMGIDFAFDREGRLWVLEVNSNHPQFHPLKRIDPTAYRRMMSFARAYGRHDAQ